jgi:hypothetical protein
MKWFHIHKWIPFGEPVRGIESSNLKHHLSPDIQRFKCRCGRTKVKRGNFSFILPKR